MQGVEVFLGGHPVVDMWYRLIYNMVDALYRRILFEDYGDHHFFDFGKSTEGDGTVLNESLIYQKEGFGARGVCYDWYEWKVNVEF